MYPHVPLCALEHVPPISTCSFPFRSPSPAQNIVEFLPDYSDSEDDQLLRQELESAKNLPTVYRVGSVGDFEIHGGTKLTEDLNRAKSDGLLFERTDTFIGRTKVLLVA